VDSHKANTTDRRLVEFRFVSLYNSGLILHIGVIINFDLLNKHFR